MKKKRGRLYASVSHNSNWHAVDHSCNSFPDIYMYKIYWEQDESWRVWGQNARYISIVDRVLVGQESSVALVKVSGRMFLLGITGENVNMLTELTEDELTEIPAPVNGNYAGTAFKDVIERLKDRKK